MNDLLHIEYKLLAVVFCFLLADMGDAYVELIAAGTQLCLVFILYPHGRYCVIINMILQLVFLSM